MSTLSVPNSFTAGTTISSSQVNANNAAIITWSSTISDDNFSSSAGMYAAYRTLHEARGTLRIDLPAATYLFLADGEVVKASGTSLTTSHLAAKYLDDADFTVSGRTIKLRVRAVVASNATAPAINFTFGLYPVTVAGGVDAIAYTLGTVVAGSTVAINTPSASTATPGTGSDFTTPADGLYALGVVTSGLQANNNYCGLTAELQQRWT
jgi:hypothetical protein